MLTPYVWEWYGCGYYDQSILVVKWEKWMLEALCQGIPWLTTNQGGLEKERKRGHYLGGADVNLGFSGVRTSVDSAGQLQISKATVAYLVGLMISPGFAPHEVRTTTTSTWGCFFVVTIMGKTKRLWSKYKPLTVGEGGRVNISYKCSGLAEFHWTDIRPNKGVAWMMIRGRFIMHQASDQRFRFSTQGNLPLGKFSKALFLARRKFLLGCPSADNSWFKKKSRHSY